MIGQQNEEAVQPLVEVSNVKYVRSIYSKCFPDTAYNLNNLSKGEIKFLAKPHLISCWVKKHSARFGRQHANSSLG